MLPWCQIVLEFKLKGWPGQFRANDEAIRVTQFIRNRCVRLWRETHGLGPADLSAYCRLLAQERAFVRKLNSMARQAAAERAWSAISRFYNNYYAQFCIAVERRVTGAPTGKAVGLDLGLTHFYVDSDGGEKENPRLLRRAEKALHRAQRAVSRKVKGSRNRAKARKRVGRKHLQVQRQRRDCAAKAARALVMSNDVIAIEDLRVSKMVKNRHLAKSISDAGWHTFRRWLEYLARVYGKTVVAVPPEYTTQECSRCGTLVRKALSQRTHVCPQCGLVLDRDHNSARVILSKGLALLGVDHTTVGHDGKSRLGRLVPLPATGDCRGQAQSQNQESLVL